MRLLNNKIKSIIPVLVLATILFTGCDSSLVDNGSSPISSDFSEMQRSEHEGELAPVCEVSLVDISLVLDVSGSTTITEGGITRLQAIKNGAKALVDQLSENGQGALVSFNQVAQRNLDLTIMDAAGQTSLNFAIDGLTAGGATNIQGGIIFGAEELTGDEDLFTFVNTSPSGKNRTEATKVMVVLSDGQAISYYGPDGNVINTGGPDPQAAAVMAANTAKTAGIRVFTIAIGGANQAEMAALASSPDDAFTNANLVELVTVFSGIAESICPTAVAIDVKPGSDVNPINTKSKGVIPVAVLTTDDFDATTIDPETVRFGSLSSILSDEGALLAHTDGHIEDVNDDGRPDFMGHFATQDAGFTSDDEYGWLVGETTDGESIAGRDMVQILKNGKP